MYERVIATVKEFNIIDDNTPALARGFKQSTTWTVKVINSSKYVYCKCYKTWKPLLKDISAIRFFFMKKIFSKMHLTVKSVLVGRR